jgi:hypothetical protein
MGLSLFRKDCARFGEPQQLAKIGDGVKLRLSDGLRNRDRREDAFEKFEQTKSPGA